MKTVLYNRIGDTLFSDGLVCFIKKICTSYCHKKFSENELSVGYIFNVIICNEFFFFGKIYVLKLFLTDVSKYSG